MAVEQLKVVIRIRSSTEQKASFKRLRCSGNLVSHIEELCTSAQREGFKGRVVAA